MNLTRTHEQHECGARECTVLLLGSVRVNVDSRRPDRESNPCERGLLREHVRLETRRVALVWRGGVDPRQRGLAIFGGSLLGTYCILYVFTKLQSYEILTLFI